ncbi:MAG: histidine--tRNA ligase [Bacilli bacterium]|nr:histidine--tRNA ligase [Bacilli bacterium]
MQINPVKGTHDIIGDEAKEYELIESRAKMIVELFNYKEIRTPVLEPTNLFIRSVGESSDIVNKEMYTFNDKGDRSLTLRPEVTAGVMRSIVSNKLYATADLPLRYYYCGPCFRYERPQAGRYRQFHQFGVEAVGAPTPELDAETISIGANILAVLGFQNVTIKINSLGDEETRNAYREALKAYFAQYIDQMCPDCKRRYEVNPLRILDCKVPEDAEIVKGAPKLKDFLSDNAKAYFNRVKAALELYGITNYELDETLVRGLDYYTGVVWEYHIKGENAIDVGAAGGGGHYKNLLKEIGGPDLEGVGLALGVERVHYLWKTLVNTEHIPFGPDVYIMPLGENVLADAIKFGEELRSNGYSVEVPFDGKSLKSMFKIATRANAKFALIIGEDELDRGELTVKNLHTSVQTSVKAEQLVDVVAELVEEYMNNYFEKEDNKNGEN